MLAYVQSPVWFVPFSVAEVRSDHPSPSRSTGEHGRDAIMAQGLKAVPQRRN